jgi:N-acetylglucosaminyldiphosphoundecaprenol N-acetyl-beta-D-mannosaminyltransferase
MTFKAAQTGSVVPGDLPDDLSREVYCILGMPIDVIGMQSVLRRIETAAATKKPFFLSTPNLNFLVNSQWDSDFRESLLQSDLNPADGMPIVWIAQFLGIPAKDRIAGSDIFDSLKAEHNSARPLKIFLFGGAEGVAAAACRALNVAPGGLSCVGSLYPGFGSVDDMSRDDIFDNINSSDADFLVASLGAQKGQLWLQRNHQRLLVPVRAHLGAVINFQAARLRRAPRMMRRIGLEWLWRIKEEPHLWRRYWNDGCALLRLLATRVMPLAIWTWWLRLKYERHGRDLAIKQTDDYKSVTVSLIGHAIGPYIDKIIPVFREAITTQKQIIIDFSKTRVIDARFLGLLLMLRKKLKSSGASPAFTGLSPELERMFRLNGLEFLL